METETETRNPAVLVAAGVLMLCLGLLAQLVGLDVARASERGTTRVLGPVECGQIRCHQLVTTTRPWLDTDQTVTVIRRHSRPVEGRNSITAPWGPFHLVVAYIGASPDARTAVEPRDPAFMEKSEYIDVAEGQTLARVKIICACSGAWNDNVVSHNGNAYHERWFLTPIGAAFVMFRMGSDGSWHVGFYKAWCPGDTLQVEDGNCTQVSFG